MNENNVTFADARAYFASALEASRDAADFYPQADLCQALRAALPQLDLCKNFDDLARVRQQAESEREYPRPHPILRSDRARQHYCRVVTAFEENMRRVVIGDPHLKSLSATIRTQAAEQAAEHRKKILAQRSERMTHEA